ncbi:protein SMAX1-LIKE 6-like isoform X1 [Tripterygium wilfordii]|uniref:protein SMAX1-LIKE 6-like isoform X1 n=1 Tax=Tripterygium wilfordii TaxID=458696 RepID=UPI0018F85854|nr:protein SMAX1-LIKE 6-like isoform X1 [Tripterygium wilfordii]
MPTPVSAARQCLTAESAHALDEAVSVARRRGHSQTTSLHAVSAIFSLPASILRDACARARSAAYSPRLQFKALELCLSVSLDRVSSSQLSGDPPVSNSLMAAIKRSQANQRRHPDNFHLYHQISQNQSAMSCIKVELQHLVLSILDDPVVSRVFGEAGFRSSEIKLAILRPLPQQLFKYPRSRIPPLFLCNLTDNPDPGPIRRGASFSFSGFPNFLEGDENCKRITEVLGRPKERNPLLVGLYAHDALATFVDVIERKKNNTSILPIVLSGSCVISIGKDISKLIDENSDRRTVDMKFEELSRLVDRNSGPGLILNYGDLDSFFSSDNNGASSGEVVNYIVAHLTRLLQLHNKVWLIGATVSYEPYLKCLSRFPSIEKDWDMQVLPINSLKPSLPSSYPKSSLMGSFVPFGGFFSSPSDSRCSLSTSYQCLSRCRQCDERCAQEVISISKEGTTASVSDHYQSSLSSCLHMAEISTDKRLDLIKDDGMVLSTKVAGAERKWDDICWRLHHTRPPERNINSTQFPTAVGFQVAEDKIKNCDGSINNCVEVSSSIQMDLQKNSKVRSDVPAFSKPKNENFLSMSWERPFTAEDIGSSSRKSPCSLSNSSIGDGFLTSPPSLTSVTTDLGLGITCRTATSNEFRKSEEQNSMKFTQKSSGCFSANVDIGNGTISDDHARFSSSSCPDSYGQFDPNNFKMLYKAVTERVGWQDEAVHIICQTVVQCRERNETRRGTNPRRDIWFNFAGPDPCGKRKIAASLAELIYGSREYLVLADLSSSYDARFRGKTAIDYIAEELGKKGFAIVFLESVDKADLVVQSSLSQALWSGKFPDSYGREVSTTNAIFVITSTAVDTRIVSSPEKPPTYSEEKILGAKAWLMMMLNEDTVQGDTSQNLVMSFTVRKGCPVVANKRKLFRRTEIIEQNDVPDFVKRVNKTSIKNLDLNIPSGETEMQEINEENTYCASMSDNSKAWLQDFLDWVDKTVVFKPFDFDGLANNLLAKISNSFHSIVGSECMLEIESKVTEQLLAAAYFCERNEVVENWVEQVLSRGFMEVQKRYNLDSNSVVKLVCHEGHGSDDEQMPKVYLPLKILLN